jgi:hypothetical protein
MLVMMPYGGKAPIETGRASPIPSGRIRYEGGRFGANFSELRRADNATRRSGFFPADERPAIGGPRTGPCSPHHVDHPVERGGSVEKMPK